MKRKIIKQGTSSLTIILPSKWAAKQNLKQGDDVGVIEQGNDLVVTTKPKPQKLTTKIDTSKFSKKRLPEGHKNNFIEVALGNVYIKGYDTIEIFLQNFDYPGQLQKQLYDHQLLHHFLTTLKLLNDFYILH